jgi:hypothetical protein
MKKHINSTGRFIHRHRHDIADALMIAAFLLRNLPDGRPLPALPQANARTITKRRRKA